MVTKTSHGFTLWAVPRFHRQDVIGARPGSGKQWDFHSYAQFAPETKEDEALDAKQGAAVETTRH